MITDRVAEQNNLEQYYRREGSQILVVYGQKHLEKTSLLLEFTENKPYFYYTVRPCSDLEQLCILEEEAQADGISIEQERPTYLQVLKAITEKITRKKVIIIDEFHYMVRNGDSFFSDLIEFVGDVWSSQEVLVILASSSIGYIENSLIQKIGEGAHHIAGFLKIREVGFMKLQDYFPKAKFTDCIGMYSVLGGAPELWSYFTGQKSIKENICEAILPRSSFLHEEGFRMVTEELREMSVYDTILHAISQGKQKLNDLHQHTGYSRAKISVYLKNLIELELVEKVFSYETEGRENAQKGLYRIKNNLTYFAYRFLYSYRSKLALLSPEEFYDTYIAPTFRSFMGEYFPEICSQYLEEMNGQGQLPIAFTRIGKWVGKTGSIDIVAQDDEGRTLVGYCDFGQEEMKWEDYEWFLFCLEQAKLQADVIYLFSAMGFANRIKEEAKINRRIQLIRITD